MAEFTLREKLVDQMTGGALTAWYNAIEDAISRVDIINLAWIFFDYDCKDTKVKYLPMTDDPEVKDPDLDLIYDTSLPFLAADDYDNKEEVRKCDLLFETLKNLLEREGLYCARNYASDTDLVISLKPLR